MPTIDELRSSLKKGLASPSRFDVLIPVTDSIEGITSQVLSFRCESADLPGLTYATADLKMSSAPIEKYPYLVTFNEINLTFIVSDDMSEKKYFDRWLTSINPQFNNYDFDYKQNYARDITIRQYDIAGNVSYAVKLLEAFPTSMNQLDLEWSTEGYHKLAVTFAYTKWTNSYII